MKLQDSKPGFAGPFLALALAVSAPAQVATVYLPDANAGTGVIGNMIPFSPVFGNPAGAWSHLTIVPAGMLTVQGVQPGHRLVDIRFAPCGSGTIHMSDVQIVVGHLVNPLPTFSLLNGLVNPHVAYDSAVSGPLSFPCVAHAWSSLGVGGGDLAWDGVSDVGVYSTHAGLTISSTTGWQGSFWREASLMRHYVNAYQASSALTSSLNALKLSLVFADPSALPASFAPYGLPAAGSPGFPFFTAQGAPSFGNDAFGIGVAQALPGAAAVLLLSSGSDDQPIGVSSDARLLVDLSGSAASFAAAIPVGGLGTAFFPAPMPDWTPALAGLTVFGQWAIVGDPGGQLTTLGIPVALTAGVAITIGI